MKKNLMFVMLLSAAMLATALPQPGLCAPPQRIISLAPSMTEILYATGLGNRVVAVSDYCDYPEGAKLKPKVGGLSNPSLEMIVSLKPDMVVMTTDGNPKWINDRLLKLGISTYVFQARKIADLPGEIRKMGAVLGTKAKSDRLAGKIEKTIARLKAGSAGKGTGKAVFIVQPDPLIVAADGNAIQDALEILGWTNIAAAAGKKYVKYSVEELIRQSPDVVLIGMGHRRMREDSRELLSKLKMLPAVRNGRVYYTSDALFRLSPRVIEGIEELSAILFGK